MSSAFCPKMAPGIDGKIAVALQPLGSGRYSHDDLLEQLNIKENRSAGITHCFSVLVDEPSSYKMLAQSKTFGKWKASYETWCNLQARFLPPLCSQRCVIEAFLFVR